MKTPFLCQARALLLAAVLPLVASAASESPSLLLQKGIYAEETEHNLDSAIKIYEQVVAEAAANRAVVAQAQYRLAVCYQKQGKKEQAAKVFNDLLQQTPLDAATRTATRERLTELGAGPAESFAARRLSTPEASWFIATSSDGRFMAYSPKKTDSVVIHEFATGKTWTTLEFAKDRGPGGWIPALFSPDNQWLAYDDKEEAIFVTKVDGSETKKLFEAPDKKGKGGGQWTTIVGWSGDSTEVFFTSWANACECRVLYAGNVKTGVVREIARPEMPWPWSSIWRFSASGRYVAVMSGAEPRKIRVLDLQSNKEEVAALREDVKSGFSDSGSLLGWALGDTRLLFTEYRGTEMDVWSIPMKDGKRAGNVELLWRNLRALVANGDVVRSGVTRDGTLYCQTYGTSERTLWAVEGLLTRKTPFDSRIDIPVAYLMGPNNSIRDPKYGFAGTLPTDWVVTSAQEMRTADNASAFISVSIPNFDRRKYSVSISYGPREDAFAPILSAKGPTPGQTAAHAEVLVRNWSISLNADHVLRRDNLVAQTRNGNQVFTAIADYSVGGVPWIVCFSSHNSVTTRATLMLRMQRENSDKVLPEFQKLIDSVELTTGTGPKPRGAKRSVVRPDDVIGADNLIRDPVTGLSAVLPTGWEPMNAFRSHEETSGSFPTKFTINLVPADHPKADARISYFTADDQKAIATTAVEHWMKQWAEKTLVEFQKKQRLHGGTDYRIRPSSFAYKTVNGHPALSWTADFTAARESRTQYSTLIYGETGNAWIRLNAPATEIGTIRGGYERILDSIRIP